MCVFRQQNFWLAYFIKGDRQVFGVEFFICLFLLASEMSQLWMNAVQKLSNVSNIIN